MLHEVVTSEKVPFTFRVAGIGSRFLATAIDLVAVAILLMIGAFFAVVLDIGRLGLGSGIFSLWFFALFCGYFLLFEWLWLGQTPGKRLLGIRVIRWDGANITFAQSALRNLLRIVDVLPGLYGVAAITALTNPEQRRLGDLAANTLVVHVHSKGRLLFVMASANVDSDEERDVKLRLQRNKLSKEQKKTIFDLCLRRNQLRFRSRTRLFHALGNYYRKKEHLEPKEHASDENFILELAAVLNAAEK